MPLELPPKLLVPQAPAIVRAADPLLLAGFMVMRLTGFGAKERGASSDVTANGTNIGDCTNSGGLAAAFDGNTAQAYAAAATRGANNGYVGRTYSQSRALDSVTVYGASNTGFDGNTGATTCTVLVWGKNGAAPSAYNDGTQLATTGGIADSNTSNVQTIQIADKLAYYTHLWVSSSTTGTADAAFGEVIFTGWIA